jgi:hypothetical protein
VKRPLKSFTHLITLESRGSISRGRGLRHLCEAKGAGGCVMEASDAVFDAAVLYGLSRLLRSRNRSSNSRSKPPAAESGGLMVPILPHRSGFRQTPSAMVA